MERRICSWSTTFHLLPHLLLLQPLHLFLNLPLLMLLQLRLWLPFSPLGMQKHETVTQQFWLHADAGRLACTPTKSLTHPLLLQENSHLKWILAKRVQLLSARLSLPLFCITPWLRKRLCNEDLDVIELIYSRVSRVKMSVMIQAFFIHNSRVNWSTWQLCWL